MRPTTDETEACRQNTHQLQLLEAAAAADLSRCRVTE